MESVVDQLNEYLADFHANAVVTGHFTLRAPWSFDKEAVQGVPFRICKGAPYHLFLDGQVPVLVQPGDVVLLPHGDRHRMSSDLDSPPTSFNSILAEKGLVPTFDTPLEFEAGGDGAACELHTAIVGFPNARRHPLFGILPALIHIRADDPAVSQWLKSTLQTFIEESISCQPGWTIAAARLSDVLFVQMIRAHIFQHPLTTTSWLRGLFDPQIGKTILAIRRDPGSAWSLSMLAETANMSRSRFASRFTELVKMAPMTYVTEVRMHFASNELTARPTRISTIASRAGYESEKSFTRAFKRWAGISPGAYALRYSDRLEGIRP